MFNPIQFYEAGKARSGTALIPFFDSTSVAFGISTRNGDTVVDWGDGSSSNIAPVKMRDYADGSALSSNFNKSYSSALNGNVSVKFLRGLKDVYSIFLGVFHNTNQQQSKLNILDVETFFKQFPNLFSLCIEEYAYQTTSRMSVIKGDLAKLPNSVERVLINQAEILNAATDFTLNFSSYTNLSNLKVFRFKDKVATTAQSTIKVIGDVGKIPTSCQFFYLQKASAGSSITYTAGKIWASAFDTLSIPLSLTTAELDALLADMDGSILTKTGAGVISVLGYRSPASDAFVASLQSKGFTVNILRFLNINSYSDSALLRLDFQNNFDVYSNSGLNIAEGGTSNQPTFALSGRKAGEYCAIFNGSQSIKTTTNLPINSDKVTAAFWMKTTQTTTGLITEISEIWSAPGSNSFSTSVNGVTENKLYVGEQTTNTVRNVRQSTADVNDNTWRHVAVVFDRANPTATKITLYINGVSAGTTATTNGSTAGNFVNNILFIGQRAGSSIGFNGSLTKLKIYNYPFTPSEVSTLYNSEL